MKKAALYFILSMIFLSCSEKRYQFNFTEINTPGNSSLRAIYAVDENILWTSGSEGQIYLSLDGGESWNQRNVPACEDTEFRSLHAWDALRALVFDVSPEGRAYMTTDGGVNWKQVYQSPTTGAFFNSLKFADDQHGIAISDPVDEHVFVLKTNDGGRNWERLENLPSAAEGEINFAASNTCIEYLPSGEIHIVTGGSKSRVLHSLDRGKTWEFVNTPMMTGASAGLFSIRFTNADKGVAVGGDFNQPDREGVSAIYTLDGGKHWSRAEKMPSAYRSCVVSLNDELVFATGKTGCDYSIDGGRNWVFIDSTGYYAAHAVDWKNIIFLAGSGGRVARAFVQKD